jgi:hypothetical protein
MNLCPPADARCEIKFVAYETELSRILQWIHLHPACFFEEYPMRQVNNIYFDSYCYSSFADNISGASSRLKIRYRWYGVSILPSKGAIEIKCKRNIYSWKKIFQVDGPLMDEQSDWKTFCGEVLRQLPSEGRVLLYSYPMVVMVNRYRRKYFISRDRKFRITVDSDLNVYDQTRNVRPNWVMKSNNPQALVLEVKFHRRFKPLATHIINSLPIRASRHSKYIVGLQAAHNL